MASWGTPVTHFTGDTLAVSDWNTIANNETFLYQASYCNYYDNGGTNVNPSTYTQVALGGVTCAGYGFSVSSNNVVVPLAGIYWVAGALAASSNQASGWVAAYIYHNGSLYANGSAVRVLRRRQCPVVGLHRCQVRRERHARPLRPPNRAERDDDEPGREHHIPGGDLCRFGLAHRLRRARTDERVRKHVLLIPNPFDRLGR